MITKKIIKNFIIIFTSTLTLFITLNFILFFSNKYIHQSIISKHILFFLPAELTYFYQDTYNDLENYTVILGDSHVFGSGDSYLNDDYNYSIGHQLYLFFKKETKKEVFLTSTFDKKSVSKIKSKLLNYVS